MKLMKRVITLLLPAVLLMGACKQERPAAVKTADDRPGTALPTWQVGATVTVAGRSVALFRVEDD